MDSEVLMSNHDEEAGWMAPKKARTVSTVNNPNISFNTPNKFQPLSNVSEPTTTNSNQINETIIRPPPIFVKNITNFIEFRKILISQIGENNFSCISKQNCIKVMPSRSEHYRTLVTYFKNINCDFHTYQLKEDKPYRVVIRNFHYTTDPMMISRELELKGHKVLQVVNALHPANKRPLDLFFVDLKQAPNNSEIFEIRSLLNTPIKVEETRPRRNLVQCHNCQEYGHTRRYCNHIARCVKCGLDHETSACTKRTDQPPKCALCAGTHPANYRGCQVHKNLQQLRNRNQGGEIRRRMDTRRPDVSVDQPPPPPLPSTEGRSYAQTLRQGEGRREQPAQQPLSEDTLTSLITSTLHSVLQPLLTQLITQLMGQLQNTFLSSLRLSR